MATNGAYYDSSTGLNLTSGGSVRINIATGGGIKFNNDYTFPTSDGSANELLMTDGAGNVDFTTIPNASLDNSSVTVTAGTLLDNGGTVALGGTITLNVDLSELSTSTSNTDGDFFAVIDSSGAQKKLTKGNINNSGFNNDAGYITSAGNTNIYSVNGTLAGVRRVNQNGNNLEFDSTTAENTNIYKTNNTTINTPRLRVEADGSYGTVLELTSNGGVSTTLVDGYDQNGKLVFSVDGRGALNATSKSFLIPHPSKEGFSLRYGSLEGPEHGVYVRGKLEVGKVIKLPDYWLDLVDEDTITVQLTPIGSHQNLYVKDIIDNTIVVNNSNMLNSKVKCFYFIQAERKDIDKMVVEYSQNEGL